MMIGMANAQGRAALVALVCVAAAACSTNSPSHPQAGPASSPHQESAATATAVATTTPSCIGLSICTPPPPDAEGNPACNYRDGWDADPSGSGINVYYFRESSAAADAEQVTADIHLKDGTIASQIAAIEAAQTFHRIQFPGIDKAAVQEVLLNTGAGRCFVIGPDGS